MWLRATRSTLAAVAVLATATLVAGCDSTQPTGTQAGTQGSQAASWDAPIDPSAAAQDAGLPMLGQEMLAVHYHAHLDVIVDDQHITVPAGLGIDNTRRAISPLHTHDTSGIVHIESGQEIPFTLSQLFTEWGQPLTTHQVGPKTISANEALHVYRNGKPIPGDPAALKFQARDEIAIWAGPTGATPDPPNTYEFPAGL
jgi:hypothetical protein